MRMRLLNPGPVTLTSQVRSALSGEDLCHREPEFAAITREVADRVRKVYGTENSHYVPALCTGSGTAAVEMMLGSFLPRDSRALVISNGVYGDRMAKMLQAQGKSFDLFEISWTEPVPVLKIESLLQARTDLREVVVVHHETTTGRLNPLGELGRICRTLNRRLYLDAVSSFGAEEILFEEWNLEALAGTMNKCLHGAPGVSFTLAHPRAYDRPTQATSFVLDAYRYQDQIKSGFSPFTQSIPVMRAALLALQEHHEQGGWKSRRETYRARMKRASETLARLNVPILLETDDASSCVLKSFRMPKNTSYESLHTHLKERGFIIYAGQGAFSGEIFRISLMGDLREADLRDLDVGFSSFFHQ